MKVLLIDPHGDALDWGVRIKAAGHQLRHFIKDAPRTKNIGRGLTDVVRDFHPLRWPDLIIMADNTLYLDELDFWNLPSGQVIIGPTKALAQWELDREVGCQVLESHGINVIPYRTFDDYDAAIAYVKKRDGRLVSKPCGDADKALSYLAGGPDPVADMVYMLEKWKRDKKIKGEFILQDFVEGIEMGADGWFGPGGFNRGWSESFEFKKLMPGNYGVNTGEMGTVLRFTGHSTLAERVLEPLAGALDRHEYCGYISVNCIIDSKGQPWPLEFTMRPGYPTINIEEEIHANPDPAERLYNLARGHDDRSIALDVVSCGIVVAGKHFPNSHTLIKETEGIPVFGWSKIRDESFHACQLARGGITGLETAGDYCLVVTGSGRTVEDARRRAFERAELIHMPGGQTVRIDVGERLKKELPKLHKMGYAKGMDYE